ncbi:MAG: hypothetical protein U0Q19_00775 [Kineosporiaceae bacterium]
MSDVDGVVDQLENDRAAVATLRLLIDPATAGETALALLHRDDPLGVMFLLGGLQNAGADTRAAIEGAAAEYATDAAARATLTHHLTMAQRASDPRTARTARELINIIALP